METTNQPTSPKDGAQRQREFAERKRAQGLKQFRYWVSDYEAHCLQKLL